MKSHSIKVLALMVFTVSAHAELRFIRDLPWSSETVETSGTNSQSGGGGGSEPSGGGGSEPITPSLVAVNSLSFEAQGITANCGVGFTRLDNAVLPGPGYTLGDYSGTSYAKSPGTKGDISFGYQADSGDGTYEGLYITVSIETLDVIPEAVALEGAGVFELAYDSDLYDQNGSYTETIEGGIRFYFDPSIGSIYWSSGSIEPGGLANNLDNTASMIHMQPKAWRLEDGTVLSDYVPDSLRIGVHAVNHVPSWCS